MTVGDLPTSGRIMRRALTTPELRLCKPIRDEFLAQTRRPIMVVLDGVSQNDNIGAIFRLSDAFLVSAAPKWNCTNADFGARHSALGALDRVPAGKPSHRRCEGQNRLGRSCRTDHGQVRPEQLVRDVAPAATKPRARVRTIGATVRDAIEP